MRSAAPIAFIVVTVVAAACQQSVVRFPVDAGACPTGAVECGGRCVVLAASDENCGACGQACAAEESCAASRCWADNCGDTDCSAEQVCWTGRCTEKLCVGVSCGSGETCYNGTCHPEACGAVLCPEGSICIDGACTDVACIGVICPSGESCRRGVCVATCATGSCGANPGAPCFTGALACDGGCVDAAKMAAGVSCGTDKVCDSSGACVACIEHAPCGTNPGAPCSQGRLQCGTGAPICVDGELADAGANCGVDKVCTAQGACIACAAGQSCTGNSGAPCILGGLFCGNGIPMCADQGPAPAGTSCGTSLVCSGDGGCVACVTGSGCGTNPGAPCIDGTLVCSGAAPSCNDTTTFRDAGTSCGVNLVCNTAGLCVGCTQGLSCSTSASSCKVGSTSCSTGTQTCVDTAANLPDGTPCGTDHVCSAGVCMPCTTGAVCGSNPTTCYAGIVQCGTGAAVCADNTSAPKAVGVVCGSGLVCDGSGSCVTACAAGNACSTNPGNPCKTGLTACPTGVAGAQTCVDSGNAVDGTSCGVGLGCSTGSCTFLVTCTPFANLGPGPSCDPHTTDSKVCCNADGHSYVACSCNGANDSCCMNTFYDINAAYYCVGLGYCW